MADLNQTDLNFSSELLEFINEWKNKPGNLIMVLHRVQKEFGYIPREAAMKVSLLLDIPLAKIYGVITFYHFFKLTKPGKHKLQVCMGTACYLKGASEILEAISSLIGVPVGGITEDGMFSLESVRCVGCCGLAPVMVVGEQVFGKVSKEQVGPILQQLREEAE